MAGDGVVYFPDGFEFYDLDSNHASISCDSLFRYKFKEPLVYIDVPQQVVLNSDIVLEHVVPEEVKKEIVSHFGNPDNLYPHAYLLSVFKHDLVQYHCVCSSVVFRTSDVTGKRGE